MKNFKSNMPVREGKTLMYFSADWCGPCKAFKPIVTAATDALADVKSYFVDVTTHAELAASFGIMSVPTVVTLIDGKETARKVGGASDSVFKEWLDTAF